MSNSQNVGFEKFYELWFDQLSQLVQELRSAPKESNTPEQRHHQTQLINKLMNHYGEYHRAKSAAAERDVLTVYAAPWLSAIEHCLQWVAGWRPTTIIHLVYTESTRSGSVQSEHRINEILRELRAGSLSNISPYQLSAVSKLQCETVMEENLISNEFSEWQDSGKEPIGSRNGFEEVIGRLRSIIQKADDLRLRTMNRMTELLTPQQSILFAIAAVELQFGIRGWGRNQDR